MNSRGLLSQQWLLTLISLLSHSSGLTHPFTEKLFFIAQVDATDYTCIVSHHHSHHHHTGKVLLNCIASYDPIPHQHVLYWLSLYVRNSSSRIFPPSQDLGELSKLERTSSWSVKQLVDQVLTSTGSLTESD